jgi:two-component system, NtrC family, nitrogen regulation sensor histidine kinase GlnL
MTSHSNRLHQLILDNLHTSVLLFDEQFQILYVNHAAEMLFAMSARAMIGKHVEEIMRCESEETIHQLHNVLETGNPYTGREIGIHTPSQRLTVDCTVVPFEEPDEPRALLVELQQIDRQIRITHEEQLISQQHAAQELVRGLAHEIKNPLGGIRGAAQLLELELHEDDLKEYTGVIMKEADRLRNLVNRLLGPNQLPKVEELNIHEVLERVRQLLRVEYGESLKLNFDYDPSIPPVVGDADQLIQAILNIAANAARALGEDGELTFRTRILRQFTIGNQLHKLVAEIDIEDNGPGIPPELRETLFLPMVSGSADGAGLGLSIAQSLVARHGGLIEFESEPGKTVFVVYLPVE